MEIAVTFVSVLCIYGGLSLLFLLKPELLHKKKPQRLMTTVKHISHRGGSIEFPENTIVAFTEALKAGSEMLEMDLQLTKDREVVVFHDSSLNRVTGVNELVKDVNYADLPRKFRPELRVPFPQYHGQTIDTTKFDCHIPLLEEVFQKFPGVPMNIDLKEGSDLLLEKTHALIKKYNRENLVVWGGFSEKVVTNCYKKDPNIAVLFSFRATLRLIALYYTGLLPFVPLRESFFEIPVANEREIRAIAPDANKWAVKLVVFLIRHVLVSKTLFKHLNRRGITVFSWVQNHVDEFKFCYDSGVNGVMTDAPTLLADYLRKQ